MNDLNGALNSMYSHLNAFSPQSLQETLQALEQDNKMLQGMMGHQLDKQGEELANKIQAQVQHLRHSETAPTKGTQQMVAAKWADELKKTRDHIKKILERPPKQASRSIEKNYKPKT